MVTLTLIVLVLHVLAAALWLGPTLGLVKSVRRALPVSKEALALAVADFRFRGMLATIGGAGSLVTGLTLIFLGGGFKVMPPQIHAALGLAIIALIQSSVFGVGAKALAQAVSTYDTSAIDNARAALKRMGLHSHISHTLWLAALIMMFWARVATRA